MKIEDISSLLSRRLGLNKSQIRDINIVQSLWSGYGAIVRFVQNDTPIIAKLVNTQAMPHHPRGWAGQTSHERKLSSFINEQTFYQSHASDLQDVAAVPQWLDTMNSAEAMVMLLQDVDAAGYDQRYHQLNDTRFTQCLDWLASFHAYFLLHPWEQTLWSRGNYWHLATRQDEYATMVKGELKQKAQALDNVLMNARYQTLLHGDAKVANFCFSDEDCLALDFQYVGAGVGVVDVMYFLGSCLTESELEVTADAAFDTYFAALKNALPEQYIVNHWNTLESEWRTLIPIAWADFSRFLEGWSPSHPKLHGYSARQTQQGLDVLVHYSMP
ncbi:MAG: phosphotransferase [Alteromonadaceae bacterium]|nr:phosphotransferase [Alteromonadaceae bacterium]